MTIPKPASHPASCRVCRGTGWEPGPTIPGHHHGRTFDYTTVQPCTHRWSYDDPTVDEHGYDTVEPLAGYHPRAVRAYERGLAQGRAERDAELDAARHRHPSSLFDAGPELEVGA